jgi:hypothetical protein
VCRALESKGIRCWIAPRDILPGMEWGLSVIEAIDRARVMVLVFSVEANASPIIRREVERASSRGILILPLRIEDVPPSRALEYFIGNVQWFDALTPPLDAHLQPLADRIKMQLERVWTPLGAMPAEAGMPCVPAPAPPPMPCCAPAPPSYGAPPGSGSGGGLFRGLADLFRRSKSAPSSPSHAPRAPAAPRPAVPVEKPAPPTPASPSAKTTHPSRPLARVSSSMNSGASPEASQARVDFSVYAPPRVQPGSSFLLNVWASLPGQRAEMVERATGPGRKVEMGSRGGVLLPSETPLLLRLRLDGFALDNPMEPFAWHGEVTNVSFLVSAPAQLAPGAYPGEVQLLDGGMLTAKLYFEVTVAAAQGVGATPPASQAELRAEWVRSAFASYASPDREKVVQRVQGITAAGVKVYLDVASLRTGHEWKKQLFHAIENADVFYLFWSRFAKASEHVETEWRTALDKKGLAFIHPIPLEDPRQAQPPDELSSLHFNDIYLAILSRPPSPESKDRERGSRRRLPAYG